MRKKTIQERQNARGLFSRSNLKFQYRSHEKKRNALNMIKLVLDTDNNLNVFKIQGK